MTVVACVADDRRSMHALRFALDMYEHMPDDPDLHVLHVTEDRTDMPDDVIMSRAIEIVESHSYEYPVDYELLALSNVPENKATVGNQIVSYATEEGADHVVMGNPKKSVTSHVFGATISFSVQLDFDGKVTLVHSHGDAPADGRITKE